MSDIKMLKGNNIYLPCTPSKWTSEPKIKPCLILHITNGGGLGKAYWHRVVNYRKIEKINSNQLETFVDAITGELITVNTSFIVEIQEKNFVSVEYHTENKYIGIGKHTLYYCTDINNTDIFTNNRYRTESDYTTKL